MEGMLVVMGLGLFVFAVIVLFARLATMLAEEAKIAMRLVGDAPNDRRLNMEPPVVILSDGREYTLSSRGEPVPTGK